MPLDKTQMKVFNKELDHKYAELLDEIRDELTQSGDSEYIELLGRGGTDTGEEAVRDLLWGLNSTLYDRHIGQIREIELARQRMSEGDYGVCVDCGEDIGVERLRARPTAKRCIYCQQQHERTHAHISTPNM